jgi:methylphosphotriester-DNA--protein-cysteine methyltransferase
MMTEEETKNDETEKQLDVVEVEEQAKTTDEVWREVGQQFEALGKSLSQAFRATWESEETRKQVKKLGDGLDRAAQKVEEAIKKAGSSPEAQKLREEAEKTAESLQTAGQKTWEDARPHLLSALTQFNTELQKMIDRLEHQEATPEEPPTEEEPDVTEEQPEG